MQKNGGNAQRATKWSKPPKEKKKNTDAGVLLYFLQATRLERPPLLAEATPAIEEFIPKYIFMDFEYSMTDVGE